MGFRTTSSAVSVAAVAIAAAGFLSSSAARAATSAASRPAQLTGTHLLAALLPAADFPRGFTKSNAFSTGSRLEKPQTKVNLATVSCRTFLVNLPERGYGETAVAGDVIGNSRSQGFDQIVFQFPSTSKAASFYRGISALYARCRSVRVASGGAAFSLTTQSLTQTRVGGHETLLVNDTIKISGPDKILDGTTINHGLFTLAGPDVYSVDVFGTPVLPASPSRTTTVLRLIARVQAAR